MSIEMFLPPNRASELSYGGCQRSLCLTLYMRLPSIRSLRLWNKATCSRGKPLIGGMMNTVLCSVVDCVLCM